MADARIVFKVMIEVDCDKQRWEWLDNQFNELLRNIEKHNTEGYLMKGITYQADGFPEKE